MKTRLSHAAYTAPALHILADSELILETSCTSQRIVFVVVAQAAAAVDVTVDDFIDTDAA